MPARTNRITPDGPQAVGARHDGKTPPEGRDTEWQGRPMERERRKERDTGKERERKDRKSVV